MDEAKEKEKEKEKAQQEAFLAQLDPSTEKKTLEIARRMLGTSFDLRKCNGFLEWQKKQ